MLRTLHQARSLLPADIYCLHVTCVLFTSVMPHQGAIKEVQVFGTSSPPALESIFLVFFRYIGLFFQCVFNP